MASVERRGKNSFRLVVEAGYDAKGKRIKRSKTVQASGIREAEKELMKFQAEVEAGEYIAPSKMTFSAFLTEWKEKYGTKHLEPMTLASYDHMLKNHILPNMGHLHVSDVTPLHVLRFLDELSKDGARKDGKAGGLSTTTIRYIHRIMKDIFERAVRWRVIKDNPVSAIKRPKIAQRKIEVYDEQEAEKLFEALEREPIHWRIMITLALTTGLRRGELQALEWKHVNIELCEIEVVQALSHANGVNHIKQPKTEHSIRKVSIPESLLPDLREYYQHCSEHKRLIGELWEAGDRFFVFFSEAGKPFYHTAPGRWFSRFSRRTKLRKIRFHDLRHTSATLLINMGVHAKIISSRLGHADIRTTMNTYGHALRRADQAAGNAFNTLLQTRPRTNASS
jgi:integrase